MSVSYKSKELGWLSYLSKILSSHWPKSGGGQKKNLLAPLAKLSPHFQNRGAAPALAYEAKMQVNLNFSSEYGELNFVLKDIAFVVHYIIWLNIWHLVVKR